MKSISMTSAKVLAVRYLSVAALTAAMVMPVQAVERAAQGSGDWPGITWDPAGAFGTGDIAGIGNGYSVDYVGPGTLQVGRIYIGSTIGGATGTGTLEISAGTLDAVYSGSLAVSVGATGGGTGTLNLTGGTLMVSGAGGFLNIGAVANSTGYVYMSAGSLSTGGAIAVGGADGAMGTMEVTDGTIAVGGDLQVGRRVTGTSNGTYTQTGGTITIAGNLRVGHAQNNTQNITGTMLIDESDITVNGSIFVGRQTTAGAGTGLGSGKLSFGSQVNLTIGSATVLEVSGNGELAFILGATDAFNTIDLSMSSAGKPFELTQNGAVITVDGAALDFASGYDLITLLTYGTGKAPTNTNFATFNFINFDAGYTPGLTWTSDSLVLSLYAVPEPSTAALLVLTAVGGMVARRRQRC